ncbi:MAG TPA: GvpL/GvpF family gas vesicle protein [Pyrinomonadaceae bacterium]|nr:GvpL/GvpF family gas vesicle protein [Pyrinomonadaceae bacterium]
MKLYAYCLAENLDTLAQSPPGVSRAPVRLLKIDNLAVLVSDTEIDAVPATRDNALAHAAVVRSVLGETTPLPFRFGALVTEQQLRSYISSRKPALEKKLAHVAGCVEMNVKIIWEPSAEKKPQPAHQPGPQGAGATFLEKKRREILGDELRASRSSEISAWLHDEISGLTRDEQVTVRPTEKLLLAAAHLVERVNIQTYRARLAETRESRSELHFLTSGPWPPYSFANIELEFETHFGVT